MKDMVGTDSSRPVGLLTRRRGRDESVPTIDISRLLHAIAL